MKNAKLLISLLLSLMLVGISFPLAAKSATVPEPFKGQDNKSKITISYDDFSQLLRYSVLDLGKSKRPKSPKSTAKIGSRVKTKRQTIYTGTEGNRFLFKNFRNEANVAVLTTIRQSLEQVPNEVLMSELNAREQLAYWLNLYNVTLLEQLALIYPKKDIEDELYGKKGIMKQKLLTVAGVKLSLNDIQNNIVLGKFSANPLVIYGFFQGTIGGPNIRTTAYTGHSVIKQLRQNASEFINSNRGTFKGKKGTLRVSSFYDTNRHLFPNFEKDLKKHLSIYIDDNFSSYVENAKRIKANIKSMNIVDIMGGQRQISSSAATNDAALLGSASAQGFVPVVDLAEGANSGFGNMSIGISSETYGNLTAKFGRYSPQDMALLMALKKNRKVNTGTVTIKEDEDIDSN